MSERAKVCTSSGIPLQKKVQPPSHALDASIPLAEAPVCETKECCTSARTVDSLAPEVIIWVW